VLASAPGGFSAPGASDYTPPGQSGIYLLQQSGTAHYDPIADMWTTLAAPPYDLSYWPGPAWVGNSLYAIKGGNVLQYDIPTDTWSMPLMGGVHDNNYGATTQNSDSSQLFTVTTIPEIATYDIATNSMSYVAYGGAVYEPHVAWDVCSSKLYISPAYDTANLDSYDPATGAIASLASQPEGSMNDAFCGDRSGHLYAAGGTGGESTFWKYDIATNSWTRLPDLPFDEGNDGACTVTNDGWLYMTTGDGGQNVARIQLN
jgi:hypothetical protein